MAETRRLMVEGRYPISAMVAMKSASASGSAGRGVRPASSHHRVNAAQSPWYARLVFSEESADANALADSEMGAVGT
jgi:hypothetical protein